jgi:hypothetical protein
MFGRQKETIKQNSIESKTFNNSKGNISLNFTLRVDIKGELVSFLELLKEAQRLVEEEIKNRFK